MVNSIDMDKTHLIKKAKRLIAAGDQDQCLDVLVNWFDSNKVPGSRKWKGLYNNLILISNKFNNNKNAANKGTVDQSVIEIGNNKLTDSLLDFLDQLEEFVSKNGISGTKKTLIHTSDIELTINTDFDSFSEAEQEIIIDTIAKLLKITKREINIKMKKPGSVKLILELNSEKANELKKLVEKGELLNLKVSEAKIIDGIVSKKKIKYGPLDSKIVKHLKSRSSSKSNAANRRAIGKNENTRSKGNNVGIQSKEKIAKIFEEFGVSPNDHGSVEGQIALFTYRIKALSDHLRKNKKDHSTRRTLLTLVGKRKRLLTNLAKNDITKYKALIEKLGIRK